MALASAAGLLIGGLFLLGILIGLLRPVLPEAMPRTERSPGGWFRAVQTRGALVLVLALLVIMMIAVAGAVGGRTGEEQPPQSVVRSSIATETEAAETEGGAESGIQTESGKWLAGDMHTHTFLTDGNSALGDVAQKALNEFGLNWIANSEHGGMGTRDASGKPAAETPRWWSLTNWSWPTVSALRARLPDKIILQGVEWNVPKHEHASVGFASDDPSAVAEFDYRFDRNSKSTSLPGSPPKDNTTTAGAVSGVAWLQANYDDSSYVVLNHPSRELTYRPRDVREFIAAGPDIMAGFEGMPGYQKGINRGGYDSGNPLARTYQGADIWLTQVGGFWDSILANGYPFHVFANSDFHDTSSDFWPGEYAKNWIHVAQPGDMKSLVAGLKSGRSFSSFGDLVDELEFSAQGDGRKVTMGRDALVVPRGTGVVVTVRFHTPSVNNHGDSPKVDHLDLISGDVTGPAVRGEASWDASTNPSTRVAKTFKASDLQQLGDGWYTVSYRVPNVQGPLYLRLRATNLAPGTPGLTDAAGNPLMDAAGVNSAEKAWKSLWFYSNPVWIDVQ